MKNSLNPRKTTLLGLLMLSTIFATAQQWSDYATVDGVKIYQTEVECRDSQLPPQLAVLLKVENTTSQTIKIEWDLKIWYNDVEHKKDIADGENHYTITLEPNQSIEGDCGTPNGALYIYKDFLIYEAKQKLTHFELSNITVSLQ
ncbi:MAG: hypothetical protein MK078_13360 [Crocinitomicaceae bacterium]|nr:hypothetical protein [Crocinitomicaceae bacterium]